MRRIRTASTIARERRISFIIFISPWVFGFLLFQVMPIIFGLTTSLTNQMAFTLKRKFIGLANYVKLLSDPDVRYSFLTTFIFTLSHTCLAVITGLIVALLLEKEVPGRGVFRTLLYFPYMIPLIAVGWIFRIFLDRDTGFFNIFLMQIGLIKTNIAWIGQFTRGSIVSLAIWMSGWSMIIFLGGLSTIPNELHESARIDGAGYVTRLFRITLPLLSPFAFFQFVTSNIFAMQKFIEPYIIHPKQQRGGQLTQQRPPRDTFFVMTRAYDTVFNKNQYAMGLALLWLLFLVIVIITIVFIKLGGFVVYSETEDRR